MLARQAETEPSGRCWPRMRNMPRCSICTDFLVAPEPSVFKTDGEVSYLWRCDRCGQGFVTEARFPRLSVLARRRTPVRGRGEATGLHKRHHEANPPGHH